MRLITHVIFAVKSALRGIAATPGTAAVATGTIAVALLLSGAFALTLLNMQGLVQRFGDALQVVAFLEDGLAEAEREALAERAARIAGVAAVQRVSETEALERFRDGVGRGFALLDGLDDNPLPPSLELTLEPSHRNAAELARVSRAMAALPGVTDIASGSDWVEGYVRALALLRGFAIGLGVLLALATLLIVSNTIRLAVLSRIEELEILSLVGASRGFVTAPFLLEGALQGLAGGVLAWLLLFGLFRLVLPGFEFGLELLMGGLAPRFFDAGEASWLWGGGAGLGVLGSALAVASEWRRWGSA